MSDPFPDYDSEPVIDLQYAATGKRPAAPAAAAPPPDSLPPAVADALMKPPADKVEARARLARLMGGGLVSGAMMAGEAEDLGGGSVSKPAPRDGGVRVAEASAGDPRPKVSMREAAAATGREAVADAEAAVEVHGETHRPPEIKKNRPPAAEPSTLDRQDAAARVASWRAANPEKARELDAAYRERHREEFNERKRVAMAALRKQRKLARMAAARRAGK